ncbi:molybdopterin-dependent oxidoreductase [Candidatus Poribacteria bacterium]|nr:molybdopterin-dependent oxidoreductase [Candidatus Poribacteria bacterium]
MSDFRFTRREFLRITGATTLALSLDSLGFLGGTAHATEKVFQKWEYKGWESLHRDEWKWDKVTYGTHLVDCYPGNCLWRVYTKDGIVWREEQAGKYPIIDATGPDWNPRGCQKGCSYSNVMYNPDRVKYPMKRVGERGEGKWKRISWDEAITEVCNHLMDAIQNHGSESIIFEPGGNGGWIHLLAGLRFFMGLGATELDIDSTFGDFNKGVYETFGKFQFCESCDAWFFGKLILIWHMNPVYTRIPDCQFINSARYNGSEIITIAPDYSPSAIHADEWIPVEMGTDAALGLGIAQYLIARGTYDQKFLKEQTDFPLLVRTDTKKFLRQTDIEGKGREDQLYFWNPATNAPVKAPRGTLELPCDPALEGGYTVILNDGSNVEVRPVFDIYREMLDRDYTPEQASKMCGTHPDTIRRLADKAWKARGHVEILLGWNAAKYYHGDLIERAMCLLLALTGSVGNKGSGIRGWNESLFDGATALMLQEGKGAKFLFQVGGAALDKFVLKRQDPEITEEIAQREWEKEANKKRMGMTPPAFLYYFHSNYRDAWNKKEWHCPTMKRSFDEYMTEALKKGWWDGVVRPAPDQKPQVYCFLGTSPARKNRGWLTNIYPELWKQYKFIFTIETRWSTTALMSDMVLPGAGFYEKTDTRFPTPHVPWLTMTEAAVPPTNEAMDEWEVFRRMSRRIEELAEERRFRKYEAHKGTEIDLSKLVEFQTMGSKSVEETLDDALKLSVQLGTLPQGTSLQTLRKDGIVRFTGVSKLDIIAMHLQTEIKPDEPIVPLTNHTGVKKIPYPTYNRRITFYIDHDWFIEAGEELPVHKDNPKMGGNYPLRMTSGHLRWSVHSIWVTDDVLARTHQGRPFMFMNPEDAKKRGIEDGDLVRVFNDFDDFRVHVKLTSAARCASETSLGQVIIYHAWEPYQFDKWKSYDAAIPGMIKWLDLAAGYGHLDYYRWNWCTQPIDRAISVDVQKA